MRPLHVLPLGPRFGPDHRIGPVVWIHRPIHEPVGLRVGSERQPDRATGPAGITQPVKERRHA